MDLMEETTTSMFIMIQTLDLANVRARTGGHHPCELEVHRERLRKTHALNTHNAVCGIPRD